MKQIRSEHAAMERWIHKVLISAASWYNRKEFNERLRDVRSTVQNIKSGKYG